MHGSDVKWGHNHTLHIVMITVAKHVTFYEKWRHEGWIKWDLNSHFLNNRLSHNLYQHLNNFLWNIFLLKCDTRRQQFLAVGKFPDKCLDILCFHRIFILQRFLKMFIFKLWDNLWYLHLIFPLCRHICAISWVNLIKIFK
jgi:hypothetical protein